MEGQSVILQCNITTANPATNVTWFYSTNTIIPSTNGSILWPSVNRNRHGLYTCRVSIGIGSPVTKTTFLTVNCRFSFFFTILLHVNNVFEKGFENTRDYIKISIFQRYQFSRKDFNILVWELEKIFQVVVIVKFI